MFILNLIKQRAQRRIENKRIAMDARSLKEQEIANEYSAYSLSQILDLISYEQDKLNNLPLFSLKRKNQRIFIAGLYRAHKLISARAKAAKEYDRISTIANAPIVFIDKKAA